MHSEFVCPSIRNKEEEPAELKQETGGFSNKFSIEFD